MSNIINKISVSQAAQLVQQAQSIIIASHENPDADGLSCTLALGLAFKKLGKQVRMYNPDPVPQNLRFLPAWDQITSQLNADENFDLAIIVDLGEPTRVGGAFANLKNVTHWMAVDHHGQGAYPLAHNFLDSTASSSGIMVYRLFNELNIAITKDLATLIYTSISADTGSFKYSNVNAECLQVASRMVALGVDVWQVAEYLWEIAPVEKIKLLAQILPTLTMFEKNQIAMLTITLDDLNKSGASSELTEGFINIPRSIDSVEIAAIIREVSENLYKISLRSKHYADVSSVCAQFGGGGHARAAGCKIKGSFNEVQQQLLNAIKLQLKK